MKVRAMNTVTAGQNLKRVGEAMDWAQTLAQLRAIRLEKEARQQEGTR